MAPQMAAQVTTTTIYGTITDTSGGAIAGAQVIATNVGTNLSRAAASDSQGRYLVEFLPVGSYQVEIAAPGFMKFRQSGIVLEVNERARVDATLGIGAVTETVTVSGDAPLVNTANAQIGRTVTNAEINDMPIVNRNVYTLLTLTPGVESSSNSIVLGYPEQRTMINGGVDGGAGSVNYYLDGGANMTGLRNTGNVAPNPDAIQEFRVVTNGYSAEFGRFSAGVINILTKSGTNQIHGSLFEFLRNDVMNANVYDALVKAPLRRNQFGASAGGPIKKNKTFFFGTYGGLRQDQPQFFNAGVVPTALERKGNFSQSKPLPTDPNTANKQPFAGGIIPTSRFDPTALNILNKFIPLPNSTGNVYQYSVANPYNTDEVMAKIDHTLNAKHQLSGTYYETSGRDVTQPAGNMPWSLEQFTWRQQNMTASDTWIVGPNSVNQFYLTYTRNFGGRLNLPQMSLGDLGSSYKIQGAPSLPQITVTNYFTLGQSIAGPVAGTNNYGIRNLFSNTRGRHTLKFGGELSLNKDVQQTLLNNYGVFAFNAAKSNNNLSDFLLGLPATMNQDAPVTALDNSWWAGLFVQDDFRFSRRLTFNLGLRWDLQTPPTDPFNRESTFEAGVQSTVLAATPAGLLVPGDPGVRRGIVPAQKRNFSPRLGMAFDPFGNGMTSIRAAAGVFYGFVSGNEWNSTSNYQPFAVREQFNDVASLTNPYGHLAGGVSPFPYSYDPKNPKYIFPASIYGIAPNFVWPYTYQLNFSIQRQFTKDVSMTAAYVGSLGHRLPFATDLNYPYYNSTATTANVNNRRPILPGTWSSVYSVESIMQTSYHGFQVNVDKKMGRRLGVRGFYTFSKTLEGAQLTNNTVNGGAQDYIGLSEEKSLSENNRRHRFSGAATWQADYFSRLENPTTRAIINGWMVSAVLTFQSGTPVTVTSGADRNLDGNSTDRANLVGNPYLDPNRPRAAVTAMWFNTAAFVTSPVGVDGTAGRNIITGPGVRNVDMSLFRNFRIAERCQLQARGEFTNALNLVSLSNPNVALNSSLFGTIRTAGDMRQTQVGLRLTF